jgi:hypothetical protein
MEQKRSTFPTSIKTLDGERRIPTEAELDHMLYELVRDTLTPMTPTRTRAHRPDRGRATRPGPRAGHTRPAGPRERPNGSATTCSICYRHPRARGDQEAAAAGQIPTFEA